MTPTSKVYRFESVHSTNLKMKELIHKGGAQSGTVVVAEHQTEGRGRLGRSWASPVGGLYVSLLWVPKNPKRMTDFSILAGLAVSQTVKALLPKSKDVSVKWPNDCLVDWKKIAGVLCETVGDPPSAVIIGMGINVNTKASDLEPFLKNPFSATSMLLETEGDQPIDVVLETLLTKIFQLFAVYEKEGFAAIRYLWEKNCLMVGKKIELRDPGYQPADGDRGKTTGFFLGIDDSGALLLAKQKKDDEKMVTTSYISGEIACFWP